MPFIQVDEENSSQIELYYEDRGSGKPVVLIHGWPLSGRSWEKQVPALVSAGYRVITYDRRGFGESSKPTCGYDYDTLAADLHMLLTRLHLEDVTLVGFSMGGGEVARYIGTYGSNRVNKAVFVAAIPPFLLKTADNPEGVEPEVFRNIEKELNTDRFAFFEKFFSDFYNADVLKGKSACAMPISLEIALTASPKGTLDCVSAWGADFRKDLERFDIPTLIVHGDADRIVPIEASGKRMPEMVKGSKLSVVEGAPHGLNWTHAEQLNRELIDFIG